MLFCLGVYDDQTKVELRQTGRTVIIIGFLLLISNASQLQYNVLEMRKNTGVLYTVHVRGGVKKMRGEKKGKCV